MDQEEQQELQTNESWNGSSWTELADMNTARAGIGSFGTQSSALGCGGDPDGNFTELWNGSAWTEVNNLNVTREGMGSAGGSDNTSGIVFGGNQDSVEEWNGTNWSNVNKLNTNRNGLAGCGSVTLALATAGGPPITNIVEEWNGTGLVTTTVTTTSD